MPHMTLKLSSRVEYTNPVEFWKCTSTISGEPCATMSSPHQLLILLAASLGTPIPLARIRSLTREFLYCMSLDCYQSLVYIIILCGGVSLTVCSFSYVNHCKEVHMAILYHLRPRLEVCSRYFLKPKVVYLLQTSSMKTIVKWCSYSCRLRVCPNVLFVTQKFIKVLT